MAEPSKEELELGLKILEGLRKTSLKLRATQLHVARQAILREVFPPVAEPEVKKRRCGASYPEEDGSGWSYCVLSTGHPQSHEDADGWKWQDGYVTTVVIEQEVRSVPDHMHDFVGDEDTCTRYRACTLTWGEFTAQDREWNDD